jgi:hypothetical protein
MKEGLIDIWIAGGYFRLQEWSETVAVAKKFGVPVWASLDESRVAFSRDSLYNSRESYRARAMNAWRGGVDSLFLFNFFYLPGTPQFDVLKEIGDRALLARLDKVYVPDARGRGNAGRSLNWGERYFTRPETFSPDRPLTLKTGRSVAVNLLVGDDLSVPASRDLKAQASLEIEAAGLETSGDLTVRFNKGLLTDGRLLNNVLTFAVDREHVRLGSNRIYISPGKERSSDTILKDLRLWIRYKPSER